MKKLYFFIFLVLVAVSLFGQNVEIQGDATITGQVTVMDTILFADGTELASACLQVLQDADSDTKIEVEKVADEDIIRFTVEGNEIARFIDNRLEIQATGNSVFIGYNAGVSDNGANNFITAVGNKAGEGQINGFANTYLGASAGNANEAGNENTYVGTSAGYSNISNGNTMIGRRAGFENTNGSSNTFLGNHAGHNTNGSGNVLIGNYAGENQSGSNKLMIDNTNTSSPLIYGEFDNNLVRINGKLNINNAYDLPQAVGTSGQVLSYDGSGALQWSNPSTATSLLDSDSDTGVLVEDKPDEDRIRFRLKGTEHMRLDETNLRLNFRNSIYIGNGAGTVDDGNNFNTAIGGGAGGNIVSGQYNTVLGNGAAGNMVLGSNNVIIGNEAASEEDGSNNTFIGRAAGFGSSGNGNVFLGYHAGYSTPGSNKLVIDNGNTPIPFIYGEFDNHKLELDAWTQVKRRLDVDDNDLLFTNLGSGDTNKGVKFGNNTFGIMGLTYENTGTFGHSLHFKSYFDQAGDKIMTINGQSSKVGVGIADPETKLHVKGVNHFGHIMKIENTSSNAAADGLEIKINRPITGLENNYVTFKDANSTAGRIEGFAVGEGPNFTDFPDIDFSAYFDIQAMIAAFFDPGSFPYPDLNTLEIPSIAWDDGELGTIQDNSSFDAGAFVGNVICITSPVCNHLDPNNLQTAVVLDINLSGFEKPTLTFDEGAFPTWVPGTPPSFDLDAFLNPTILTSAFVDIQAIAEWAFENGMEALSADPFHLKLMGDPDYWSNMALAKNGGVTYGSKGADYAEWLEREDPNIDIKAGQIVGVKNGKISLKTEDVDQIMAISVMPVVLGNMPDTTRQEDFEKVAFIGQTPVWVVGQVESGDYIIASGNNDGYGLAVAEEDLTIEQVSKVVGRAWEDGDKMINLVNMAVGLKTTEMATILSKTTKKVDKLESRLERIEASLGIGELAEK